ncbi:hypothetical protein TNCV_3254731 [Trichonephila clavipes]|nr:hypothetical protein TNCV_3254731 [Trichonephila clavipes]
MPSKPDKFGIKFWLAADVDSKYVLNGFPYLCKDEKRLVNLSVSEYVVLRLIEPFENKRNQRDKKKLNRKSSMERNATEGRNIPVMGVQQETSGL